MANQVTAFWVESGRASRTAVGLMLAMMLWLTAASPAGAAADDAGLVLHYTFEAGSGNIYDKSTAKNNGTPYGATYVQMHDGYAMGFASKAAFAKCAHRKRLLFGQGDFTVELWLKLDDATSGSILGKKGQADQPAGWAIAYGQGGELTFTIADHQQQDAVSLQMADADGWHHLVAVRSGKTAALFLDGKEAARKTSDAFAADVNNTSVFLHLGKLLGSSSFHGKIDDLKIYQSALPAAQIAKQYRDTNHSRQELIAQPDPSDALVAHYRFDSDPGDVAKDLSPAGNDAKIINGQFLPEVAGRRGVLRLNGKDAYIDLGDDESLQFTGDTTFEMWVRKHSPIEAKWARIFGDDPIASFHFSIAYWYSLAAWYRSSDNSREAMLIPVDNTTISEDWSHIAMVIEYPRARYYHNGKLIADRFLPVPGLTHLRKVHKVIGGSADGSNAPIDLTEFRLYRRALSAAEIAAHAAGRQAAPITQELTVEPNWYKNQLTVRLTAKGVNLSGNRAELQLLDNAGQTLAGQQVFVQPAVGSTGNRYIAEAVFDLAKLEGKTVAARGQVLDAEDTLASSVNHEVTLTPPGWITANAGETDEVLAPWTPVQVSTQRDGAVQLGVWGRQYFYDGWALPAQIHTRDVQLLAGPIHVTGKVDGSAIAWQDAPVKVAEATDAAATVEQIRTGGNLNFHIAARTEYDGYTIYDCQLQATQDVQLDELLLDIPLRTEFARLCYGDRVLPMQPGKAISPWFSGPVTGDLAFRFAGHIWLGDHLRGLSWQAESDQDWRYSDDNKAIEVLQRGSTTTLRLHLADVASQMKAGETRQYKFALQATPVKPRQHTGWDLRIARSEPYGADLHLPDRKVDGKPEFEYLREQGVRRLFTNVNDIWPWPMPVHETFTDALHRMIDAAHEAGIKVHPYLIHQRLPVDVPEFDIYGLNMANRPLKQYLQGANPPGTGRPGPVTTEFGANSHGSIFMCPNSEALQDAYMNSLAQRYATFGDDGIYLDGTCHLVPCENMDHGCGYRAADGSIKATFPVFAVRRLMQRIYAITKKANPDNIVDMHNSWGYNPAGLAYADVMWTGEQWHHLRGKGADHIPSVLSLEQFQTEFTGWQVGIPAETLTYRLGPPMKVAAISLLHDISPRLYTNNFDNLNKRADPYYAIVPDLWRMRDTFGAGDAATHFYFENQQYVRTSPAESYVTFFKHPANGVLALVSNLAEDAHAVEVAFDLVKLGLSDAKLEAVSAITGEPVELDGNGKFTVQLDAVAWTYVWLRPR